MATIKNMEEYIAYPKKKVTCFMTGKPIEKGEPCLQLPKSSWQNKTTLGYVHIDAFISAVYFITGKKVLKKSVVERIEKELISGEI